MGTTYRCLIIDDETPAHKALASHIKKIEGLEFSGSAYSGLEALKMLNENQYDIIFLDINMPGISGVEFMELQPVRPITIITTAYSDYALAAFENDAVDYLLKPISLEKFSKAIEKAKAYYAYGIEKGNAKKDTVLTCKVNGEVTHVPIEEIIYFESYGNYVKVHRHKAKTPIVLHATLVSLMDEIRNPIFLRIHRTFIVNRDFISAVSGNSVQLTNKLELPVGRTYKVLLGDT